MSARLYLAGPHDLDRLLPMVAAYHEFEDIGSDDGHRRAALLPLLDGSPHGAVWLIGPRTAPLGYIVICFGWSIELGGMDGFVDEFYLRDAVRGRGVGTEVLRSLLPELAASGLKALHLEVALDNPGAARLYARLGFERREKYGLMTWRAPVGALKGRG